MDTRWLYHRQNNMKNTYTKAVAAVLTAVGFKRNHNAICRTEIERRISENILNEKDREIARRRFIDGKTYEELADEFGYSTQGIVKKMRKARRLIKV